MKKLFLLGSTSLLFFVIGCSENTQKTVSTSTPAVARAAAAPANPSPAAETASLPVPSAGASNHRAWRTENVKDRFINGVELKTASLDGKYDLVILQEGRQAFLSFTRHGRWESVHNQPAKGKLMVLRAKFEDGQEKLVEWDELGFATENLYGVLWSYPAPKDASLGPALPGSEKDSFGGDQLLLQDMLKHKAILVEVEPGVTTQFDLTQLAHAMEKARASKTEPILEARQDAE